jgi:hypothetical protein
LSARGLLSLPVARKRPFRYRPKRLQRSSVRALLSAWPMLAGRGEGYGTLRI